MAIFGVELDKNNISNLFIDKTKDKLASDNLVTNPFKGRILDITDNNKLYAIVDMSPIYFPVYYFGFFAIITTLIWFHFNINLWLIPGLLMASTGILWHPYFYYFMLKKGLKKLQYVGSIKYLNHNRLLSVLLNHYMLINFTIENN